MSVLRVALTDATLTQCGFNHVFKRDAIRARPLLVHTYTYALIVIFKSTAHADILRCVENFTQTGSLNIDGRGIRGSKSES